jgi:hypothetical protein
MIDYPVWKICERVTRISAPKWTATQIECDAAQMFWGNRK